MRNNADHNHTVTVTAKDPSGGTDTVDVTIRVMDVNETPVLASPIPDANIEGATGDISSGSSTPNRLPMLVNRTPPLRV